MTMNFETLQTNIVNLLTNAAAGRYRVAGYQPKSEDAEEYLDMDRLVSVFYSEGQFPKNKSGPVGPIQHETIYRIEMFVTKSAEGDLATINNPASTPAELQTALANVKLAEQLADDSFNELVGIIYQILMDARNRYFGMPKGTIADRWLDNIRKDSPLEITSDKGILGGKFITLTGSIDLTCVLDEEILGDSGTAGFIYDNVIDITDDDNEKTGVLVDHTPSP
jgi:hypothetical protein